MSSRALRRYVRTLLLVGTLLAATALTALAASPRERTSPAGRAPALGVQVHPLWEGADRAAAARQIDAAADAGAGLVRVDVGWASLQQDGRGRWSSWHLRRLDAVVERIRARGLRALLTVADTPCWASGAPSRLRRGCRGAWWTRGVAHHPPRRAGDYADALGFLARRYRGAVDAWEIWNEPNQRRFLRAADPAAAYARMLRAAYPAIKAVAPRATVVAGSLAESDHAFTERLYRHGVKGSFDAWAVHPYSGDDAPLDPVRDADPKHSFLRGVPAVRRVMLRHGDDKPLWLTEFGWSTATGRTGPRWERGVDAGRQAAYLAAAVRQMRAWPYVEAAVWYTLRDTGPDRADSVANYGLLEHDGRPKPSRAAFRRAAGG